MSDRNEVRVSDQDVEMLAIKAISAALAPLDEGAANRVLDWADARFGTGRSAARLAVEQRAYRERSDEVTEWMKNMTKGMEAMNASARSVGVTPQALIGTIERVYRQGAEAVS